MSYIVKDAIKAISKLGKLDHQTKNYFKTKFRLENNLFGQKLNEKSS